MKSTVDVKRNERMAEKYIFVLYEQDGEQVRAVVSYPKEWHKQIAAELETRMPETAFRVHGGGWLEVNLEERVISAYGDSGSYGRAPQKEVADVLRECYPGFEVKVND